MRAHTIDYETIKRNAAQLMETTAARFNDNPSATRWRGMLVAMAIRQNARNLIRDDEASVNVAVDWAQFVDATLEEYEAAGILE